MHTFHSTPHWHNCVHTERFCLQQVWGRINTVSAVIWRLVLLRAVQCQYKSLPLSRHGRLRSQCICFLWMRIVHASYRELSAFIVTQRCLHGAILYPACSCWKVLIIAHPLHPMNIVEKSRNWDSGWTGRLKFLAKYLHQFPGAASVGEVTTGRPQFLIYASDFTIISGFISHHSHKLALSVSGSFYRVVKSLRCYQIDDSNLGRGPV